MKHKIYLLFYWYKMSLIEGSNESKESEAETTGLKSLSLASFSYLLKFNEACQRIKKNKGYNAELPSTPYTNNIIVLILNG